MQALNDPQIKFSFATRAVPQETAAGFAPLKRAPRVGELAVAEVIEVGRNTSLEIRSGVSSYLFPGDTIVGVFGNRYATDQYEGYVPTEPAVECDLMSAGGLCGEVVSRHAKMAAPTRLRLLGLACGRNGAPLNTKDFSLPLLEAPRAHGEVILVVGTSMNAGKTTTMGSIARSLTRSGSTVAAAKITGTAAGKDSRYLASCGAAPVFDFIDAGHPSTYMADPDELLHVYRVLLSHLRAAESNYIMLEVADGLIQRETRLLLESAEFRASIDHVFFAAIDSLSAAYGVQMLLDYGLPALAVSGAVSQSALAMREVEQLTGLRCLSTTHLMNGQLSELLASERPRRNRVSAAPSHVMAKAGAV